MSALWAARLAEVGHLAAWVDDNLRVDSTKYDSQRRDKKQDPKGRAYKARQYVYDSLALGKMHKPLDNTDPLFTPPPYLDTSMETQLAPGRLPAFMDQIGFSLDEIKASKAVKRVSWDEATRDLKGRGVFEILQSLQDTLCEHKNIKRRYQIGRAPPDIQEAMVCLILRYKCLGAFDHNFHASVPHEFAARLPGWVECFASPFNHKFDTYYSMFEEDKEFGSLGNFFARAAIEGKLAPGRYEINPPWNVDIYDKLVRILERSSGETRIQAIVIAPSWRDAPYWSAFNHLIDNPAYIKYSFMGTGGFQYVQDLSSSTIQLPTTHWVFSTTPADDLKVLFIRHAHTHPRARSELSSLLARLTLS